MKKRFNVSLLISALFFSTSLYSIESNLDIDSLLDDIKNKTDLSEKTKLENSGISFIYTRDDIERMQARYLKDILKSGSIFGYSENKYGLPDPLTQGDSMPFMSSSMRVFIDNQEITGGMYGSGLILYGDLDIEFVDHIEIYTQSPTYEYSTEPTIMLIKLYSKSSVKDEGTKISLLGAQDKSLRINAYTSRELSNNWSYFTYVSRENLNRTKYKSFDTEISRDKKVAHIFSSVQNENNNIYVDFIKSKRDGFSGPSLDATPTGNSLDLTSFHIGYDSKIDNFAFLIAYDYFATKNNLTDDVTPIQSEPFNGTYPYSSLNIETTSKIFSTELKYKRKIDKHSIIIGTKYRYKKYYFNKYLLNNIKMPHKKNTQQCVSTLFAEEQYLVMQNMMLTAGIQNVYVYNKDALTNKKNNLLLYRFGITHLIDRFIFKTVFSHSESYLEPYLIDSSLVVDGKIKNNSSDTIYENIIYKTEYNRYEIVVGYQINENYLLPDKDNRGKLNAQNQDIQASLAIARWEHKYNKYDKFFTKLSYMNVQNIGDLENYNSYKFVVRNLNTYKKFDIFHELIYDRDNINKENFYDYSTGFVYHHKKNLNLSFKAENLFDKADVVSYIRIDPVSFEEEEKLKVSPIDRRFTLSMEYLF